MEFEITGGVVKKAQRVLIYGQHGIGKTTLASQFPGAVLIDVEDGSGHLDVRRFPRPTSWTMLLQEVAAVPTTLKNGDTVVIDSADWAERLATDKVCTEREVQSIESIGYGKGYVYVADEFRRLLRGLDRVIDAGINVVMVAHDQIGRIDKPDESASYSIYGLKLGKHVAPLVKEWADAVLYCRYKESVIKSAEGKTKAVSTGTRVIQCSHTATIDAKNRWGIDGEVPMSFEQVAEYI